MDLREYLFRNEMKTTHFAKKVGYSAPYINAIISGMHTPSERLAKVISLATDGIVPTDGICSKKRGRAAELAKKACQLEQMTFAEMQE